MKDHSGVCKPGNPEWKTVRIFWGNTDENDFNKINPFPELRVPSSQVDKSVCELKRDIKVSPFDPSKTYNSGLKSMDDLFKESDYDFDDAFRKAGKVTDEILYLDKEELRKPDIYLDNTTKSRVQEIRSPKNQLIKKRKGIITNAVSQFVIVKIEMTTPILAIEDLPDITTWAFLQPPTIGRNKHRISVNNGYVVDDAQKSGWFKAQLSADSAQEQGSGLWRADMQVDRYEVNEDSDRKQDFSLKTEVSPAWIKLDNKDPKIVLIKFEVVVRNDCTLTDLQERKEALREAKLNKDMVTAECGSYLKVWVRNTDIKWSQDPVDEFSEALREAMASDDESYDANNPQKFKNHTWRRSPLLSGKNSSDLLYVGLYPSAVIQRLEAIDEMMAKQPALDDDVKAVNYGAWLATTSLFALFCYALHEANEGSAVEAHRKSIDRTKDTDFFIQEIGGKVRNILRLFSVEEFAAALAVVGLPTSKKGFEKILGECEEKVYKSTYTFTVYLYKQMLDFALIKDSKSEEEHYKKIDKANKEIEKKQEEYDVSKGLSSLKNILTQKNVDKKKFKDLLADLKNKTQLNTKGKSEFTTKLDLGSLGTALKMPFPKGMPLPIPFLQWIIFSTEFLVKGAMGLDINAAYEESEKTDTQAAKKVFSLDFALKSDSKAGILFSLQSAWTAYIENTEKKYQVKDTKGAMEDFKFGQLLQDLAKSAEFNLFVGISLNAKTQIGPKFEYDMAKEKDAFSVSLGSAAGGLGMVAPAGAHIGMFKWDYKLASADIVKVTKNEGTFFEKLTFLDNQWNNPRVVRWGKGELFLFVVLHKPLPNREYVIGDNIQLALPYAEVDKVETSSADITFFDSGDTTVFKKFNDKLVKQIVHSEKIETDDFTHKSLLDFKIKIYDSKTLDSEKSVVFINTNDGNLISESANPLIKNLADGNAVELGASFELNGDKRIVDDETGPVILAPKIVKSTAWFDHVTSVLKFKVQIDNFNDEYLWVRFKEKDLINDDVLMYKLPKENSNESKTSTNAHEEWNIFKLEKSGSSFFMDAPLEQFENLDLSFHEKELVIYPQFALAKGGDYVISKDMDIEPVNVSESMIPA